MFSIFNQIFVLGVQTVAYAFPKVKIVTTACDTELEPKTYFICPGLGNFGDRYFGTDPVASASDNEDLPNGFSEQLSSQSCTPNSPTTTSTGVTRLNHINSHRDLSPPGLAPSKSSDYEDVFNKI